MNGNRRKRNAAKTERKRERDWREERIFFDRKYPMKLKVLRRGEKYYFISHQFDPIFVSLSLSHSLSFFLSLSSVVLYIDPTVNRLILGVFHFFAWFLIYYVSRRLFALILWNEWRTTKKYPRNSLHFARRTHNSNLICNRFTMKLLQSIHQT